MTIEQAANQEAYNQQSQSQLISEDEYLELIRNTDLARGPQPILNAKQVYAQTATPSPVSPVTISAVAYATPSKSVVNSGDYKKVPSVRPQSPSIPSPEYSRQISPTQTSHQSEYTHVEYTPEKEATGINVNKKYVDPGSKTKYEQTRAQYHQEIKPKKYITFKPSYQVVAQSPSPQAQHYPTQHLQHQHALMQQQAHSTQKVIYQPQSLRNYHTIVPQAHVQQQSLFYDSNIAYNQYLPQTERFVASPYTTAGHEDANEQIGSQKQIVQQPEYRIHYVNAPQRPKSVGNKHNSETIESVSQRIETQSPRYEYFDPSEESPRIKPNTVKIVQPPQLQYERPQFVAVEQQQPYYQKKVKYQPGVPAQQQQRQKQHHHHQQQQQQQSQQQHQQQQQQQQPQRQQLQHHMPESSHTEPLPSPQPSRSSIFVVSQTLAAQNSNNEQAPTLTDNSQSPIPIGHQTYSDIRQKPLPPLPITNPKRPITQAEFQALIDAGYKVTAIPVPVPVAVSPEKFKLLQQQQQQRTQYHLQNAGSYAIPQAHRQQQASNQVPIRYVRQQQPLPPQRHLQAASGEESLFASYLRPLIDYIGGPSKPNA